MRYILNIEFLCVSNIDFIWQIIINNFFRYIKRINLFTFLVILFNFQTALLFAQEPDTTDVKMKYSLDEVKVTASKMMMINSQMARLLSVIESEEIQLAPAESLPGILSYIVSADVRQRGAEGVQADLGIRGGTFDQTLILLNGVNITDPQTGHHNLNLPVSLSMVERIELLKGADARMYGPNAFSGAVNIVTKQAAGSSVLFSLDAGSYGYLNGDLSGSLKTGNVSHNLAGNYKSSKGYADNTDFDISNIFYSGCLVTGRGRLAAQLGFSGKGFGANSFYTPKYPDQFEETSTSFMSLRWESVNRIHFTPVVYFRRHYDKFMLFREESPEWYAGHNYHRTGVIGANVSSWLLWKAGKTSFGGSCRSEGIVSNILGELMEKQLKVPHEDAFYTHSKNRTTASVFIEHVCYLNKWIIGAGALMNRVSDSNPGIRFFPGTDIGYQLNPEIKLEASWNTFLRMPTFTDLYYSSPTNIGNAGLEPEYSSTLEGGVKLNKGFIKGQAALFYRVGRNMIDWLKMEDDEIWRAGNLTQVNSVGAEIKMQLRLKELAGRGWPDNIFLGWYYNEQDKEAGDYISHYVMDNLKHKLVLSAGKSFGKFIFLDIKGYFRDREGTYTGYNNEGTCMEIPYKAFWLFDAKAMYKKNNLRVFISANNIFNREYFDMGNVPQPGRWIKTGILYNLNFL